MAVLWVFANSRGCKKLKGLARSKPVLLGSYDLSSMNFHLSVLPRATQKAVRYCSEQPWLKTSQWYLAGGTALALQVGHRASYDLDFFTQEKDFNANVLVER